MRLFLLLFALIAGAYGAFTGAVEGLLLAMVCTLLSASGIIRPTGEDKARRIAQMIASDGRSLAMTGAAAAAVGLAAVATYLAQQNPFNRSSGYCWLAALLLLLVVGWLHDRAPVFRPGRPLGSTPAGSDSPPQPLASIAWDRWDWLFVAILTLLALALRIYRLSDFLPSMQGDEGEMGVLALLALHGSASGATPDPLPLFSTAFLDHPTLFHYIQAGALWLFGENLTGLRLLSVLFGALCVPLSYALGRMGWGRAAGLAAGLLTAVSHLHIHYSRMALNNIQSVWFMLLLLLLLFLAFARSVPAAHGSPSQRPLLWPYLLAGLALGLSQYFYYGSRLLPVVAAPLLVFLWREKRLHLVQFLGLVTAVVVAYGPLAAFYSKNLPAFLNRTRGVSVFTPEGLAHTLGPEASWPEDAPQLVWMQLKRNIDFFVQSGDASDFYLRDLPAFDPVTVLLFWLGLGIVLTRLRRFYEFALVSWLGLGILLAGVVTMDPPSGPRLIVVAPALYVIAGVLVQKVYDVLAGDWPAAIGWGAGLAGVAVAAFTLFLNFNTYFVQYASMTPNLMPITMAHEMVRASDKYRFYLLGTPRLRTGHGVLRFVARDAERYDIERVEDLPAASIDDASSKGWLVFALPHRTADLEQVADRYPGGVKGERYDSLNRELYATYQMDPAVIARWADASESDLHKAYPTSAIQSPLPQPISPLPLGFSSAGQRDE
jgi:4-amino-4-deoxy-L-arabinose transferase-like glycosyltransferase